MEDQTLETLSPKCDDMVTDQSAINENIVTEFPDLASDLALKTATCHTERIGENNVPVDESDVLDGNYEMCADEVPTLPIIQKIEELSNKVQSLKKEHAALYSEVKYIAADSFPGSEVFNAFQNFSTEHEHLKKKYNEENSERKQLYNEVVELKGNIRVFCRCRPRNHNEITDGSSSIVDFDSSQENELQIICSDSSRKQFKFDHVFRPEDSQEAVFLQTSPIVTSVLDGYNVCIFAYGQTGTGKTFTMEGIPENRGVNYRTLEKLFRISKERRSIMRYEFFVSMLEVYNEKIRDLLIENFNQPLKKLEIKQAAEGTQEVPGLVQARVFGTDEVWELLKSGSRARSVGSTNANELSSRSHCLLRVTVKGQNIINGQMTRSHLWLVDLAGSERVGKIEVEGERLKESQFINKSLSALGDVISALASKMVHIPYRNSKLTHMLQSSLGGDCKTLMIVQISPSSVDLGETLCSLNFASRVRGIEHGPARKQADLTELLKYKQLAEKSKHDEKETKKLQDSLQCLQLRLVAKDHVCKNLQEKVRDLENQLAEQRKSRLKQETRAFAAVSAQSPDLFSSLNQAQKKPIAADRKPPLCPSKLRLPLRRISNFLPPTTPIPPYTTSTLSNNHATRDDKENMSKMMMSSVTQRKTVLRARRGSIAFRPPPATSLKVLQPKRRASIATLRPESSANVTTPLNPTRLRTDRAVGRHSFVWDPQRLWRTSRVHSPLPQLKEEAFMTVEATPTAAGSRRSKFMGSPPTQAGSWKPKHPTVVALQRKHLVWSPLKFRDMKSNRRSLLPS